MNVSSREDVVVGGVDSEGGGLVGGVVLAAGVVGAGLVGATSPGG
jgi:hypothetical protein